MEEGEGVLAAGERHGHAVAVADHLEAADGFADFPQQGFFEVHNLL